MQGSRIDVRQDLHNLLFLQADLHEKEAAGWGRTASDAARWGLCDDHANARQRAQACHIEAMRLRGLALTEF